MTVRLGSITQNFLDRFRNWDSASRIAFLSAGFLMIILLTLGRGLPAELRQNVLIGVAGLFVVMQGIFLYANRGMVSSVTKAQRQYLSEDFDAARQTLEQALAKSSRPDFRALTLLGNTYRQLGMADHSHDVLTKAVQAAPQHHFPWYGFGRTLMTLGQYAEAAEAFERALALGAPAVAHLDHAEALYRAGIGAEMVMQALDAAGDSDEAFRALWAAYLRYQVSAGAFPNSDLIADGLEYWQAIAQRFSHTPYGQAVSEDIASLSKEEK